MAELVNGETLEVGGLAGRAFDEIYLRGFEIDRGDTVMAATHIALWNGKAWRQIRTFDREIVDILYLAGSGLHCLGSRGELFVFDGAEWRTLNEGISARIRVSSLREAGGRLFALGPEARLYSLEAGGGWTPIAVPAEDSTLLGIEAVGGEFIVCGTDGFLASGALGRFTAVELATNLDLHDLLARDALVYACGQRGMLLMRDGEEWRPLDAESREQDFYRLREFQGRTLVAAETEILEIKASEVLTFASVESFNLTAIGDILFSEDLGSIKAFRDGGWVEFPVAFEIPDLPPAVARPKR